MGPSHDTGNNACENHGDGDRRPEQLPAGCGLEDVHLMNEAGVGENYRPFSISE